MRCLVAGIALIAVGWSAGWGAPLGAPVRVSEVLAVIAAEAAADGRRQPAQLLDGALQAVSASVPSFRYRLVPESAPSRLQARMGDARLTLALPAALRLQAVAGLLRRVQGFVGRHGAGPSGAGALGVAEVSRRMVEGLLAALDAHAALIAPRSPGRLQTRAAGQAGGLGLRFTAQAGDLLVSRVVRNSPAARAGVHSGDRILQIGTRAAGHLTVEGALARIRGPVGTAVSLLVLREGTTAPVRLELTRNTMPLASVASRMFREFGRVRTGYLRVRSFEPTTATEVREHLERLRRQRAGLSGIVLDLRGNSGGVLEQALRVADLFLERGTIATLSGPRIRSERVPARWYRRATSAPLVVLVDEGTASAAELVAGALYANQRALVVGRPTYGKQAIQSVFPLSGGHALKLTVARFGYGGQDRAAPLVPHVVLYPVRVDGDRAGTAGLRHTTHGPPLLADGRTPARHSAPAAVLPYLAPARSRPATDHGVAFEQPDLALQTARRLLVRFGAEGRSGLLRGALAWAAADRQHRQRQIEAALARVGIDWTAPAGGSGGQVELLRMEAAQRPAGQGRWQTVHADAPLQPGSHARLTFTVRNAGALPLHRVLIALGSAAPHFDGREVPIGRLAPGATATASLALTLPDALPEGVEALRVRLVDGQRRLHYATAVYLPQQAALPHRWRLQIRQSEGGPPAATTITLHTRIANQDAQATRGGRIWIAPTMPGTVRPTSPWQTFGMLGPGRSSVVELGLRMLRKPRHGPIPVTLHVATATAGAPTLSWPFALQPGQALPPITLEPPTLQLSGARVRLERHRTRLSGVASDDSGMRELLVFRNGRKVAYRPAISGSARRLPFSTTLSLRPGRNVIRLVARDADGMTTTRTLLLWQGRQDRFPLAPGPVGGA